MRPVSPTKLHPGLGTIRAGGHRKPRRWVTQIPVPRDPSASISPLAHGDGCVGDPDEDVRESNGQMIQRWISLGWGVGGVGASRNWDLLD